ncbi:MAG: carboxylating nicotinate-nucleotide diphosphorylase [Actinomycetota bacterium]
MALPFEASAAVSRALAEDVGAGDITSISIVPEHGAGIGILAAREQCVIAGADVAREAFRQLGGCEFPGDLNDGDTLKAGDRSNFVVGSLRSILTAERVALNFLQRLSGIATLTRAFVERARSVQLRDTRKTTPGLRALEKYAVAVGGGTNHRFGLHDAILIKDNHIAVAGSVAKAIEAVRKAGHQRIEVECDTIDQVRQALDSGADEILLDNFSIDALREAVAIVKGRALLEASGGVDLENVVAIASTGVDAISVGALTHSVPSIDLSLDVRPE